MDEVHNIFWCAACRNCSSDHPRKCILHPLMFYPGGWYGDKCEHGVLRPKTFYIHQLQLLRDVLIITSIPIVLGMCILIVKCCRVTLLSKNTDFLVDTCVINVTIILYLYDLRRSLVLGTYTLHYIFANEL